MFIMFQRRRLIAIISSKDKKKVVGFWHDERKLVGKQLYCRKWKDCSNKNTVRVYSKKELLDRTVSLGIQGFIKRGINDPQWEDLTGYSLPRLKKHLKKRFLTGMTWHNWGAWHIDHIIPKSIFNYENIWDDDFKRCWSLSNLQPLWAKDNLRKHAKIDKPFQPRLKFSAPSAELA